MINKQNNKLVLRKIAFWSYFVFLKYKTHVWPKQINGYSNFSFYPLTMTIILIRLGKNSDESTALKGAENLLRMTGVSKIDNFHVSHFQEMLSTLICLRPWEKNLEMWVLALFPCSLTLHATLYLITHLSSLINICFHQIFSANVLFERRGVFFRWNYFSSHALRIIYLFSWSWHRPTMVCMTFGSKTLK